MIMFSATSLSLKHSCTATIRIYRTHSVHSRTFSNETRKTLSTWCIQLLFKKYLKLTNTLTSGMFMAMGDMIHQEYEYQTNVITERYEWIRMNRMFIVGACLGFGHSYYYTYLDILIPKISLKTVIQKVALDQFFCAPVTIAAFFYIMGTLEHKDLRQCTDELCHKFKYVYGGDWVFWPPVQCINFYFVPSQYRVFYINAATMVFDVFLSFMKHYDRKQ